MQMFTHGTSSALLFLIVMAVTDPDARPHQRASMIIVPADTPGFSVGRLEDKLGRRGQFDLDDFLTAMRQLKKMGPLEGLLGMIPGVGKQLKGAKVDPDRMKRTEAIVLSMTAAERRNPKILNGSRRKRIARGSGTTVQEVNQLLKQFAEMNKMMKQLKGVEGRMGKLKGLPGFPTLRG